MNNDTQPPPAEADSTLKAPADENSNPETVQQVDRSELLARARTFLNSPQVRYEDAEAKRRFLVEKGLNKEEIYGLLQEVPAQVPLIPPRTYPQPPPSNLPNMFIGIARILSWVVGGSAAVLLIYFRFIYPRVMKSFEARYSIRRHQQDLLAKLTTSLTSLKTIQTETFSVLPQPQVYKEEKQYQDYHTLDAIFASSEDKMDIPSTSLLRCAIEELSSSGEAVSTNVLFENLENKIPILKTEEGAQYGEILWETLTTHPIFKSEEVEGQSVWSYSPPTPPPTPPLLSSLSSLQSTLPESRPQTNRFQHTLQTLADFTGYIAAQTYNIPSTFRSSSMGLGSMLAPEEEEVRREIRALKGLVLNRRSFMPSLPKPQPTPNVANTS